MSNCRICGRPLSNPASVAAGVGPICAGRNYRGRIRARFGAGWGWSEIEEWEKVNHPCYSCKNFVFPKRGEEVEIPNGFRVTMNEQEKEFGKKDIGGFCKILKELVDGNLINEKTECSGASFVFRKGKDEQPEVGLLHGRDGQIELFKL